MRQSIEQLQGYHFFHSAFRIGWKWPGSQLAAHLVSSQQHGSLIEAVPLFTGQDTVQSPGIKHTDSKYEGEEASRTTERSRA